MLAARGDFIDIGEPLNASNRQTIFARRVPLWYLHITADNEADFLLYLARSRRRLPSSRFDTIALSPRRRRTASGQVFQVQTEIAAILRVEDVPAGVEVSSCHPRRTNTSSWVPVPIGLLVEECELSPHTLGPLQQRVGRVGIVRQHQRPQC